jgi:hypothetical protein
MSAFQKAKREAAVIRAAVCGPSGSGKTHSSLLLARGLAGENGSIALIDTERRSASLYADICDFDTAGLDPPYTPKRYKDLIRQAAGAYDVLVIDSLSHAWMGQGGVLDMQGAAASRMPNSYVAWREVTPEHNSLVDTILGCPCHVIATMRSKTAYEMQQNDKGKMVPVKLGMQPIQRDGLEYEFTIVWDLSVDGNIASASKDRTRLWYKRMEILTEDHGRELRDWLMSGETFDLAEIQGRLSGIGSENEMRDYWQSLNVRQVHPQYREIREMFSRHKETLSTESGESND